MTYAMIAISRYCCAPPHIQDLGGWSLSPNPMYKFLNHVGGDVGHSPVVSGGTTGCGLQLRRVWRETAGMLAPQLLLCLRVAKTVSQMVEIRLNRATYQVNSAS